MLLHIGLVDFNSLSDASFREGTSSGSLNLARPWTWFVYLLSANFISVIQFDVSALSKIIKLQCLYVNQQTLTNFVSR